MTASQKVHLRRCASSFVIATYDKYDSFLKIRAPCIWSFLLCRRRPFHDFLRDHHESSEKESAQMQAYEVRS
jgi:hypothetical protein